MNHRIALYLSGQYPGKYHLPNKFDIIFKIRQLDMSNFSDTMISLLQGKSDSEYFNTLLDSFKSLHTKEEYEDLLNRLDVPVEVRKDPKEIEKEIPSENIDLQKISDFLDKIDEEKFSRFIVMPILQALGYEKIEYKGKVNETDSGIDFYPMKYNSPSGIIYYTGVQTKSIKISNGDTTKPGKEGNSLIEETKTAFNQEHILTTGEKISISEYLIFNSKTSPESAIKKIFNDKYLRDRKIVYYGKDGILSLIASLKFSKDFFSNLK